MGPSVMDCCSFAPDNRFFFSCEHIKNSIPTGVPVFDLQEDYSKKISICIVAKIHKRKENFGGLFVHIVHFAQARLASANSSVSIG